MALAAPGVLPAAHAPERVVRLTDLLVVDKSEPQEIVGRTAAEVGAALRAAGLTDRGDASRSLYVWRLDWNMKTVRDARHGCRVAGGEVKLTSVTVEPRWSAPPGAPDVGKDWSRFSAAVRAHVQKHKDLTVTRARQLRPRLLKLHAKDCAALARAIDHFGETADQEIRAQNEEYDRRTQHGVLEGVRWPPPRR